MTPPVEPQPAPDQQRREVQAYYGRIALAPLAPSGRCCAKDYSDEDLGAIPEEAFLGVGTGDPVTRAKPRRGDVVLDLGSGAGVDVFLAAKAVGPEGRAIGVDMTPEMLARARQAAERQGYTNVEFRKGLLENLPVEDASVDLVVSNCVVNLSPEKDKVLAEAFRVLKPGGRLVVSDTLRRTRNDVPAGDLCGCMGGALAPDEWTEKLAGAGFVDARLEEIEWTPGTVSGRGLVLAQKP